MYADDCSVAFQSENISHLTEALNNDLRNLYMNKLSVPKLDHWSFPLNIGKLFWRIRQLLALDIWDAPVEVAESIEYLGVHIDNSLDWKKYIQEISKKVSQSLGSN